MNPSDLTRRKAIFALSATALSATALSAALCPLALPARAAQTEGAIHILKDPGCGCCDAYADYLKQNGFDVTVVDDKEFVARSVAAGVPEQGVGCHLAMIDGYAVSGLVPVEIINRLVQERPEITGITLPGMPANAPGMAPEKTGTLKVYAFGDAGISVYSDE